MLNDRLLGSAATLSGGLLRTLRPMPIEDQSCCDLSVIVPLYNEQDNVEPSYRELKAVLEGTGLDYEIVYIDDGSRDLSLARLREAAGQDPRVIIIQLRRNFGQTAAMSAGFEYSRGRILVPMDADLQNDPRDIPAILAKLDEPPGHDIVSGWRHKRQDKLWTRRIPSQAANRLIRWMTGVGIHDFGCTLKAYRREVLDGLTLSSELHRFLPALAAWNGARVCEMPVNHRPRVAGVTKYNLRRTVKVMLDLVTVKFLGTYMTKPLYFFGKIAAVMLIGAVAALAVAFAQKFGLLGQPGGLNLNRNIIVLISAMLWLLSVQCILFGLVCELLVRIYHDARHRPTYRIRRIFGLAGER